MCKRACNTQLYLDSGAQSFQLTTVDLLLQVPYSVAIWLDSRKDLQWTGNALFRKTRSKWTMLPASQIPRSFEKKERTCRTAELNGDHPPTFFSLNLWSSRSFNRAAAIHFTVSVKDYQIMTIRTGHLDTSARSIYPNSESNQFLTTVSISIKVQKT